MERSGLILGTFRGGVDSISVLRDRDGLGSETSLCDCRGVASGWAGGEAGLGCVTGVAMLLLRDRRVETGILSSGSGMALTDADRPKG